MWSENVLKSIWWIKK